MSQHTSVTVAELIKQLSAFPPDALVALTRDMGDPPAFNGPCPPVLAGVMYSSGGFVHAARACDAELEVVVLSPYDDALDG